MNGHPTPSQSEHRSHALGEQYRDLCADPDACAACSTISPRAGEPRADWLARLRDEAQRDLADTAKYGHPARRAS